MLLGSRSLASGRVTYYCERLNAGLNLTTNTQTIQPRLGSVIGVERFQHTRQARTDSARCPPVFGGVAVVGLVELFFGSA